MKTAWINGEQLNRSAVALKCAEYGIPEHCCDSLAGYITGDYKHVGHFLTALLSNDLKETFARADDENRLSVERYIRFLYNAAPAGCWGSPERVAAWLARDVSDAA